jgi:hypothetical protein
MSERELVDLELEDDVIIATLSQFCRITSEAMEADLMFHINRGTEKYEAFGLAALSVQIEKAIKLAIDCEPHNSEG